jgi:hypothetical protein
MAKQTLQRSINTNTMRLKFFGAVYGSKAETPVCAPIHAGNRKAQMEEDQQPNL